MREASSRYVIVTAQLSASLSIAHYLALYDQLEIMRNGEILIVQSTDLPRFSAFAHVCFFIVFFFEDSTFWTLMVLLSSQKWFSQGHCLSVFSLPLSRERMEVETTNSSITNPS